MRRKIIHGAKCVIALQFLFTSLGSLLADPVEIIDQSCHRAMVANLSDDPVVNVRTEAGISYDRVPENEGVLSDGEIVIVKDIVQGESWFDKDLVQTTDTWIAMESRKYAMNGYINGLYLNCIQRKPWDRRFPECRDQNFLQSQLAQTLQELSGVADCNQAINKLINTQALDLSDRNINDLSALRHFQYLQSLSLAGNSGLYNFSALAGLTNLVELNLSGTSLADLSEVSKLSQLKVLNLGSWSSQTTPFATNNLDNGDLPILNTLTNLAELDLSYNDISDAGFFANSRLTSLKSLNLEQNFSLKDITPLTGLLSLSHLNISYTEVSDISPLQRIANSLETLKLDGLLITDYKTLFSLRNVRNLGVSDSNFSDNDLRYLPFRLEALDLSWLFLNSYQLLQRIAPRLDTLYLTGANDNALRTLPYFPNLRALDIAFVGAGRDQGIIDNIAKHTSLELLNLDTNRLEDASFLGRLDNLTMVNLENNNLNSIDFISSLQGLESIWLYNNTSLDQTYCPSANGDQEICHFENSLDLGCAGACQSRWQELWSGQTSF